MKLTIEGVIRRVTQPVEFGEGKRLCEVHIELADQQYEQIVPLTFWNDDVDEALGLLPGHQIKAECALKGREWQKEGQAPRAFASFSVLTYELPEPKSIRETVLEESKKNDQGPDGLFD